MKPEKVTIKTVAQDAGVSVAAVSKVLRNAYGVSDKLRQNVMASIDKLGYRPSTAARGMRGHTYTVGILIDRVANPFLPEVIDSMNKFLTSQNYKSMLSVGHGLIQTEQSLVESMIDFRMDGLLLIAQRLSGETLEKLAQQIPIVALGHHNPSALSFDTINSDDELGAKLAVRALIEKGHKRIEMLSLQAESDPDFNVYPKREIGYRAAMSESGLADQIKIHHLGHGMGRSSGQIDAFLNTPDLPSAYFCWSDLDAIEMINVARQRGLRVPEDVAIVGYDNSPVAALPLIDLASIDQHGAMMGDIAAKMLLARIKGRTTPEHVLIEPHLVRRSSL